MEAPRVLTVGGGYSGESVQVRGENCGCLSWSSSGVDVDGAVDVVGCRRGSVVGDGGGESVGSCCDDEG